MSRCMAVLLLTGYGLARDVDQRPAFGVPGPVRIGDAVPDNISAQLFAVSLPKGALLNVWTTLGRNAATAPLNDGRCLHPRHPSHSGWTTQGVDGVQHPHMLGSTSAFRKARLPFWQ